MYKLGTIQRIADLTVTTTPGATAALKAGQYSVINTSDYDCFVKKVSVAADVTTSNGQRLISGNEVEIDVSEDDKIGAITASGTATLEICKIL